MRSYKNGKLIEEHAGTLGVIREISLRFNAHDIPAVTLVTEPSEVHVQGNFDSAVLVSRGEASDE